jgi:hypothetical protein
VFIEQLSHVIPLPPVTVAHVIPVILVNTVTQSA